MSIITKTGSVEKNIDLAFQLLNELLDQPDAISAIPDGATVVILPDGDPAQAAENLDNGIKAIRKGHNVYFMHERSNTTA